jgi:hypothetical protein
MRKLGFTLLAGALLALAGYGVFYWCCTREMRRLEQDPVPELAWLKREFRLDDAEFARIAELHAAYEPQCAARCARIDAKNTELRAALLQTNRMTPELDQLLTDTARLRKECQAAMLEHFYAVSRGMKPEQGQRYLEWVSSCTLPPAHAAMQLTPSTATSRHESAHH